MLIKNLAFGACLLCAGTSFAQDNHYKVREGENDNSIAHKFHITPEKLHHLNPGVHWSTLQIGRRLVVPGSAKERVASSHHKSSSHHESSHTYTARAGDNDWIVAKRFGTTPKEIRHLNPNVDWDALQIGHKLIVPGGSGEVAQASSKKLHSRYAAIAGDNVNVRARPSTHADEIVQVDEGTRVTVLDRDGEWYKVRFPKGTKGWVKGDFLVVVHPTVVAKRRGRGHRHVDTSYVAVRYSAHTGNAVLDKAQSLLGTRYSYGAMSRSGTDCSGLTTQAYGAAGVRLPRTSREQSHIGMPVPRSELKPGDLVFFKTNGRSHINHVGIYEGNGKFIHASSGKGHVTISSLNEGYYDRRFAGARRVLKSGSATKHASHKKKVTGPE